MMDANRDERSLVYGSHYNMQLKELLCCLSHRGHIAFAAGCAQRLSPWFGHFRAEAALPPDATLAEALGAVWHSLGSGRPLDGGLEYWDGRLKQLLPDTEVYSEKSTSFCLNAIESLWSSLSLCKSDAVESALIAGQMTMDTIDFWVADFGRVDPQTPDGLRLLIPSPRPRVGLDCRMTPRWSAGMATHPRILRELERQDQDILELTADHDVSAATVNRIKDRATAAVVIPFPVDPIWLAMEELERQDKE